MRERSFPLSMGFNMVNPPLQPTGSGPRAEQDNLVVPPPVSAGGGSPCVQPRHRPRRFKGEAEPPAPQDGELLPAPRVNGSQVEILGFHQ